MAAKAAIHARFGRPVGTASWMPAIVPEARFRNLPEARLRHDAGMTVCVAKWIICWTRETLDGAGLRRAALEPGSGAGPGASG